MLALQLQQLSHHYGKRQVLFDLNLAIPAGECFGLLGPNGAGKSTTMKLITGLLQPGAGEITLFNDIPPHQRAHALGYVPQEITLYEKLSARQNLQFFGALYQLNGKVLADRIETVLTEVGLVERADEAIDHFSGGMKRRINIAAALLHRPKLVILDEPTVGIDPQSRNHIFTLIKALRAQGVTIVYSTHYMEEVEALCDRIAIIDQGTLRAQGTVTDLLREHATPGVYIETPDGLPPPESSALAEGAGWIVPCAEPLTCLQNLAAHYQSAGQTPAALSLCRPSLEQVFLKLTGTGLRD